MNRILIGNKHRDYDEVYFSFDHYGHRFHLCNKNGNHISGCFLFRIDMSGIFLDTGVGSGAITPSIDISMDGSKLVISGVDEV